MWSDCETKEDCLGFSSYVAVLGDICQERSVAPLTLGIFGSWGSGKSSLMKMLQQQIDSQAAAKQFKTIWFNAWRYEGKEEAQAALIHAILNKLQEGKTLGDDVKDVLKRLKDGASVLKLAKFIGKSAITLTPDLDGFLDCFRDESEKLAETMERFEDDFEDFLKKVDVQGVVVFIDDLDRCQSSKVIEIFETIKLFLNTPQCTFVIGADKDKIEQAIGQTYRIGDQDRDEFTKDYLEKIVQLPFSIPEQQLADITCYVGMLVLRRFVTPDGWTQLLQNRDTFIQEPSKIGDCFNDWVISNPLVVANKQIEHPLKQLQRTLPYVHILARGLRGNPRQIKRFLNILGMRQRLAEHNKLPVDQDILIKLAVLEYAWPEFFSQVVETFDPTNGSSTLLHEVLSFQEDDSKQPDSPWVKVALETIGLAKFLGDEPSLEKTDLGPYLFLAQTALGSKKSGVITSLDESAKQFASRIASEDRIRADAGAKQASKTEPAVVAAVVRLLIPKLVGDASTKVRTHVLTGLDTICRQHPRHYDEIVAALGQIQLQGKSPVAFVASTFLGNAEKAGVKLPAEMKERFLGAFPTGNLLGKLNSKNRK